MMDKEPTLEETKKLWEWCGFRWVSTRHYVHNCMMHGGNYYEGWWESPLQEDDKYLQLPPRDLNNLFQYAVPKAITVLQAKSRQITKGLEFSRNTAFRELMERWIAGNPLQFGFENTLFWTICEVIDTEK